MMRSNCEHNYPMLITEGAGGHNYCMVIIQGAHVICMQKFYCSMM